MPTMTVQATEAASAVQGGTLGGALQAAAAPAVVVEQVSHPSPLPGPPRAASPPEPGRNGAAHRPAEGRACEAALILTPTRCWMNQVPSCARVLAGAPSEPLLTAAASSHQLPMQPSPTCQPRGRQPSPEPRPPSPPSPRRQLEPECLSPPHSRPLFSASRGSSERRAHRDHRDHYTPRAERTETPKSRVGRPAERQLLMGDIGYMGNMSGPPAHTTPKEVAEPTTEDEIEERMR